MHFGGIFCSICSNVDQCHGFGEFFLILREAKFVFQQCSFTLVSRECNVTRVLFDKVLAEMRPGQLAGNGNSAIKQRSETADWGDIG